MITERPGKPFETDAMMQLLRDIRLTRIPAGVLLFLCIHFTVCILTARALDPGRAPDEYIISTWGVGEGLPQNSVTAIAQTRDLYIWLGTHSGLARFDGVSFEIFNRWNTPGLMNDRISVLYEDGEGTLWVGTYGGGFSGLRQGGWQAYMTRDGLSNDYVTCLLRDRSGTLWIGTEDGLNRLRDGEISSFSTWHGLSGNSITSLAEDAGGRLLIGTLDGGVSVLEDLASGDFKPYQDLGVRVVNAIATDAKGRLFIGALKGLYVVYDGEVSHYSRENGLSSNSVSSLVPSRNGDLWVGLSAGGLDLLRNGEFVNFAEETRYPDDPVHAVLEDLDGSIWVGTDTRGLVQIKVPIVHALTAGDGPIDGEIQAVLEDGVGDLWVGTGGSGLCQVRNGRVMRVHNTMTGLPSSRIRCLHGARDGALWTGTEGGGLSRLSDGAVSTLTTRDGLSSNDVTALLEDGSGTLWIGTAQGLNRLKDGRIRAYDRNTYLGRAFIRTLFENDRGILHVGTREGLVKFYDRTPLPLYINEDGIEPDILSIYEDSGGVLWIGTAGNGLIRYEENEVVAYTTREGLFDNHIFGIAEDAAGDLWFGSYVGVFRVRREQLDAIRTGAITRLTPALYDEAEGLRNRQCTFEGEPSACRGRDGRLYFPTIEGVAVFDPAGLDEEGAPPRAVIEGMVADNVPVTETDSDLSEAPLVVQFRFTALDFLSPSKVRFEYRLEGFDEDWNHLDIGSPRTAYYFNLDPGDYVFRVRAAGNQGKWDEAGASFGFRILKPFYKRPHVYAVALAAVAAGAGAYVASRRKKRPKPEKYKTSALPDERVEEVLPKLQRLMEKDRVFLDAELNLQQLARKVGIHYNYLSRIINEKFGLSYNDYINGYRIEEAKRMLADPGQAGRTILDIAYDTGFYSKSVFNTAFKKVTGMTPSQYRKKCSRQNP